MEGRKMKALVFSQAKHKHLLLILVFALISTIFSLGLNLPTADAQAKLTLADILTGLKSKKVVLAQRNKLLTDAVWERGVTFALTPEIEKELRATGANNALIDAIRQNSPRTVRTPVPTPTISGGNNNANYHHTQADKLFDADNFEAAIGEYTRALNLNPNLSLAYVRRGFSYNYLGDIDKAFKDYASAVRTDPSLRNQEYITCVYYKTGDDPNTIIDKCTETVNKYKGFSLAYYKRGVAYRDVKNYDQALSDYSEAIRLYPKFGYAYNSRSVVYIEQKKNYAAAISDATNALRYNPSLDSAYYNRGLAYFYQKTYDASLADFNQVIRFKPDDVDAHYYRGRIYYDIENYSQAIVNFSRVISLNPKDVEAYRYRGICYYNLDNYQSAIVDYTEAIRLQPSVNSYKNRALAYEAIGRNDLAAADRRRAQQLEQQQ
jgi:tetratricopeptide (TPR) repeat protein